MRDEGVAFAEGQPTGKGHKRKLRAVVANAQHIGRDDDVRADRTKAAASLAKGGGDVPRAEEPNDGREGAQLVVAAQREAARAEDGLQVPANRRGGEDEMERHIRRAYDQVADEETSSRRVVIVPVVRLRVVAVAVARRVLAVGRLVDVVLVEVVQGQRDVARMGAGRDEREGRARCDGSRRSTRGDVRRRARRACILLLLV